MNILKIKYKIKFFDLIQQYDNNWKDIARHQYLSNDFIDLYFFKLQPYNIEYYQKLSPYLMFKYGDNLNWKVLSKTHNIPLILIRKYINKVNWWYISLYQDMNNLFILEFINKLIKLKLLINRYLQNRPILKFIKNM